MATTKAKTTKTSSKTVKPAVKKAAVKTVKAAPKKTVAKEAVVKTEVKEAKGSISVSVYDLLGKSSGRMSLPSEIFAAKVNPALMAQAVRVHMASQRRGTASTKTRSEVAGTTKKIYRQKGTGRARHGAAKAPIFVGGGITFGPRPHDFALSMPKKMRRLALFSALTSKLAESSVKVLDTTDSKGKTREMFGLLKSLDLVSKNGHAKKVMVVIDNNGKLVSQSARNIEGARVQNASNLTAYEVLNANTLLFMKESVDLLKKTFLEETKTK